MAKRKHGEDDESNVDIIVEKKPRKAYSKPKGRARPIASLRDVNLPANPVLSLPSASNPGPASNQTAALELPPGLNKGERKRWRKRQKVLAERAQHQHQPNNAEDLSQNIAQPSSSASLPMQAAKSNSQKSFLRSFGVTYLMPRQQRVWHEEASAQEPQSRICSTEEVSLANATQHNTTDDDVSSNIKVSPRTRLDGSQHDRKASGLPISDTALSARSRLAESASQPVLGMKVYDERNSKGVATGTSQLLRSSSTTGSPNLVSSHPATAVHRTSFGSRATSIPSFSTHQDPVEAFKRFSAFLHKHQSASEDEDSDDDNEDEDIEASVNIRSSPKQDGAEELMIHVAAAGDSTLPDNEQINVAIPTFELERPRSSDDLEIDQLPRFSDAVSQPTSANGSPWPANVGIKRQLSFLGRELGGNLSGSGAAPNSEPTVMSSPNASQQFDPFETNDDTQELLRTVDEISNTIFGFTRPLPASKNQLSRDPDHGDEENGVLTSASSDRRLTRSMTTPKGSQARAAREDAADSVSGIASEVSEVARVSNELLPYVRQGGSEEGSDSVGSNIVVAIPGFVGSASDVSKPSSGLSELSRSPSPPLETAPPISITYEESESDAYFQPDDAEPVIDDTKSDIVPRKKRKMTGRTSKHFALRNMVTRKRSSTTQEPETAIQSLDAGDGKPNDAATVQAETPVNARRTRASLRADANKASGSKTESLDSIDVSQPTEALEQSYLKGPPTAHSTRSSSKKRARTGKSSTPFTPSKPLLDPALINGVELSKPTVSGKKKRAPAGVSIRPFPPITAEHFGIIQGRLCREPFWLLIAVTFLNKTSGRAARPIFWALKEKYPTPELLANAEQDDLSDMIHCLGLQNQRAKRLIRIASAWVEREPVKGRRSRTLHYPAKDDGKEIKADEVIEEDADDCSGALEIGHIPGCGPYAWDSWRIFCRDVLRGVAEDYNGAGAAEGFVPEWQKVLPDDKELRACLRWMWLREGWIWNHETGKKRKATDEEMEKALKGEIEANDPEERKFAAQAAGVEVSPIKAEDSIPNSSLVEEGKTDAERPSAMQDSGVKTREHPPTVEQGEDDRSDNIVVMSTVTLPKRKTRRTSKLST